MIILSVNLAAETIRLPGMRQATGIEKRPVKDPVRVRQLGLDGDHVCSTKHHGGPDQAVYVYGETDYRWWESKLGRPLGAGRFGENLTISDLSSAEINVGDQLHIGTELVLEATAPRIPCGTLARHMRDRDFPEKFRAAERPGFYCRVIREGIAGVDDAVRLQRTSVDRPVSVVELLRSFYRSDDDAQTLRWHLSAPIAIRARQAKEAQLRKMSLNDEQRVS
jgi:MOSC domain-containing protein YiiM